MTGGEKHLYSKYRNSDNCELKGISDEDFFVRLEISLITPSDWAVAAFTASDH